MNDFNAPAARRGLCLVVSAPSGAGKSTLTRALLAQDPGITLSISATTRAPRAGEIDGTHYLFRSEATFAELAGSGALLEHAGVFGRRYGTPRAPVQAALAAGRDVAFDVDWQGHRQLRAALPGDVVGVFILPPSIDALRQRLTGRGDHPDAIAARMAAAAAEMSHWSEYDHVVVNDTLDEALQRLRAILSAGRTAVARQDWLRGSRDVDNLFAHRQ